MFCADTIWKTITIIVPRDAEEKVEKKLGKAVLKLGKSRKKQEKSWVKNMIFGRGE